MADVQTEEEGVGDQAGQGGRDQAVQDLASSVRSLSFSHRSPRAGCVRRGHCPSRAGSGCQRGRCRLSSWKAAALVHVGDDESLD